MTDTLTASRPLPTHPDCYCDVSSRCPCGSPAAVRAAIDALRHRAIDIAHGGIPVTR